MVRRQSTVWNHRFWLVAVIAAGGIIPSAEPSVWANPRPSPKSKKLSLARPQQVQVPVPGKDVKKPQARECEAWPPKPPPLIVDLYQLKLEYDCRNLTISHQRHELAHQEAMQSVALAEAQDSAGIDRKNAWCGREQAAIEEQQRKLDQWRDTALRNLQAMR